MMATIRDTLDRVNYELRNVYEKQWKEVELLSYYNKTIDLIHQILVDDKSDLNRTGSGTITTVAGTMEYSTITDLLLPYYVRIAANSQTLEMVNEEEVIDYEETDGTYQEGQPTKYYLKGSSIGFLPEPDDAYSVKVVYYPTFTPATSVDASMPWLGLFNMQIEEGIKLIAKNREGMGGLMEPSLMEMFQDRAIAIHRSRRPHTYQMQPSVPTY